LAKRAIVEIGNFPRDIVNSNKKVVSSNRETANYLKFYTPSYSIEKPNNVLAIKSAARVSICNNVLGLRENFKVLLDKYNIF
jgi:hypothetical protein